jgi:hypothetical protein
MKSMVSLTPISEVTLLLNVHLGSVPISERITPLSRQLLEMVNQTTSTAKMSDWLSTYQATFQLISNATMRFTTPTRVSEKGQSGSILQ